MSAGLPKPAFELETVVVRLDRLLPTKASREKAKMTPNFRKVMASLKVVGLIEPLSVFPEKGGKYLLLDGHTRMMAMQELGIEEAQCTVATSPEGYTYNKNVNLIPPIQASKMILQAMNKGATAENIAAALSMTVQNVHGSRNLLVGICPEAVELLRDKDISVAALAMVKKVKPMRQIEIAEIMVAAGTYSVAYARGLMVTTPKEQVVEVEVKRRNGKAKPEDLARIEHEMRMQEKDFRMLDETYNEQVMELTIARAYLRTLLGNARVVRFLAKDHGDFLAEFQRIADATTLEA